MLIFEQTYFWECTARKPFVEVYASQAIRNMFGEFCDELQIKLEEYRENFCTEETIETRKSIEKSVPFAADLFEKEEDAYTSAMLVNSTMMPDSISQRIDKICVEIRKDMNLKK